MPKQPKIDLNQALANQGQGAVASAERASNQAQALRLIINPTRLVDGPPHGAQSKAAELARSVRELRFFLRQWARVAKDRKIQKGA